ncbi:hypothetical protein CAC42_1948 [Sphaceloma murrayae]|uniref:alpha-L-rhamnosidase n=1 Tax=Sphaceloma murrayae TaxID=2082308 RepID=A0A2K1QM05_9PEZI|nr:hypothetical protein CAC42_1948 [Sphaceloma murrayae]
MAAPKLTPPTFEHHHTGLGAGYTHPRISWQFLSSTDTAPSFTQTSYDLEVNGTIHTVTSADSVLVPWPTTALSSRASATVRVRSHSTTLSTDWSGPSTIETGLLHRDDWKAKFIASSSVSAPKDGPIPPVRFLKRFALRSVPRKARVYSSAYGVYEIYVNGAPASDELMAPGWTSYAHRINYRTYDVGSLLREGENVIAIEAGEGWYSGRLGFGGGKRHWYGDEIAVLAQLEADGEVVGTDETWESAESAILRSEIYDGEVYDSEREVDWKKGEGKWGQVKVVEFTKAKIVSSDAPPVKVTETIKPVKVLKTEKGKTVVDFGQNLVGKVRVKNVKLEKGEELTFRHAEVMEDGELGVRPLRYAKATDTLIGSGAEIEDWTPRFTFHGFRYMQVDGWPGELEAEHVEALVVHSDMKRRGHFDSSNPLVNQLHKNVVWSMRGNFLSIPTDCPQRDERLGWTGDLQVFAPSASFLFNTIGLLGNWLEDLMAEQLEDDRGGVPALVCPDVLPENWPKEAPQAVWDDVTVLTPDVLYKYSSDKDILSRQLPSGQTWLDKAVARGEDGLWTRDLWQLSDWLDPAAPPEAPGSGRTDDVLVADAYLVHVTETFAAVNMAIGNEEQARKYAADAHKLRKAFQHKYISPYGNLMSNTQTGIALAIQYGLYRNSDEVKVAAANLRKLVRYAQFHIATGFAGTPVITHALTSTAQPQLAYRMLLEKTCPSWMYPVTMGATTIWERWDSMLPNGKINPGEMTSFNHYALGAVADWLHTTVGGIAPLEAGWKVIKVRPVPGGNLTSAKVRFDGPYGLIENSWTWHDGKFEMTLTVPPNSSAQVTLPSEISTDVTRPEEPFTSVESGVHKFACDFDAGEWPPSKLYQLNQSGGEPETF